MSSPRSVRLTSSRWTTRWTVSRQLPQQSRIAELRFFVGLSVEETAEALGISPATVKRDWATAKLWLYNELSAG